jgi:adenylate cyclase
MMGSITSRRRSTRRLRGVMFVSVGLALSAFVALAWATDVFEASERDSVDARFSVRGDLDPPRDVALVAIDDETFQELGEQWPFPRTLHAEAIDALRRAGARVIAYDVQFTEPSNPIDDTALADSIERARGKVVLATTEVNAMGESNVLGGDDVLRDLGARAADTNNPADPGDVWRRFPDNLDGLDSFAVVAASLFTGEDVDRTAFAEAGTAWIDYHGGVGTIPTVPFSRLVRRETDPADFRDKVVVVGAVAPSLQDIHATPVGGGEIMSGAEIQANAISTVLRDFPLARAPEWTEVALILLLGLFAPLMALRFGLLHAAVAGVAVALGYAILAQVAFNSGTIVSLVYPELSLALGVVGALGVGLVLGAFERERVRDLFSRFVPEPVVDEVLKNVDEDLRLGGRRRVVTVLFSDIRGFTTFSESREPEAVIGVLNQYLTTMTSVILGHGGTLVSFMGDGILAVFGAPIEADDHADRAYEAACDMAGPALDAFNAWMRAEGHGEGFRIGVGLNSGAVMAGNVGSQERLEYTVIGDTTNTASRIEGMTKGTAHMVMLSDSVRDAFTRAHPDLEQMDAMEVRGRQGLVVLWAPARTREPGDGPLTRARAG